MIKLLALGPNCLLFYINMGLFFLKYEVEKVCQVNNETDELHVSQSVVHVTLFPCSR